MPRYTNHEPDEDDEYDAERDYDPDDLETYPEGLYDDDGPPVVPCKYCREEMFEDAEQCPNCGMYQSGEEPEKPRYGPGIIVLILALIVAAWMAFGG